MSNTQSQWKDFLSEHRLQSSKKASVDRRSEHERDYGRILFSKYFRRLNRKTQVFPMPENEHIHNRMIHSMEVSYVGRSLGNTVSSRLGSNLSQIAEVVAAACLMHDIGNPPFGHAGEHAIRHWFEHWFSEHKEKRAGLDDDQVKDFVLFEGNAQTFRIATKIGFGRNAGMNLTVATLGATLKYPWSASEASSQSLKDKMGYFGNEADVFNDVVRSLALPQNGSCYARSPLAYLVEAADDICYRVMDLEDGFSLGLVSEEDLKLAFRKMIQDDDNKTLDIGELRARVIGGLVVRCAEQFCEDLDNILGGKRPADAPLLKDVLGQTLEDVVALSKKDCYNTVDVLKMEALGFEVIGGLLDRMVPVALRESDPTLKNSSVKKMERIMDAWGIFAPDESDYQRLIRVTDFISGMTDDYAVRVFRELTGVDLPIVRDVRRHHKTS